MCSSKRGELTIRFNLDFDLTQTVKFVSLLSQVATFILQKILLDETGLSYICQTYERFSHVAMILVSKILGTDCIVLHIWIFFVVCKEVFLEEELILLWNLLDYIDGENAFLLLINVYSSVPLNTSLDVMMKVEVSSWSLGLCHYGLRKNEALNKYKIIWFMIGFQGKMVLALAKDQSARLLKHVVRCYLRLSDNPRCVSIWYMMIESLESDFPFVR